MSSGNVATARCAPISEAAEERMQTTGPIEAPAAAICRTAHELVGGDRARTHGDKVENHANIARLWNAYLVNKHPSAPPHVPVIEPRDVALMMALLKVARTQHGAFNLDDYIDLAGYAGVAGEIAQKTR